MNVTAESYGHAVILKLKGELTADSLDGFKKAVEHQLEGHEVLDLVLDLEEVPFIDSAALEYLVDLQEGLAEKLGRVKLAKCDENLHKIMEITRLDTSFEIFGDIAEAVKAIEP